MHLQGQIKDLERYITFLQAKQKTDPETDPDLHDLHEEADAQTKVSSSRHRVTSKHVTFAEDMINNPISFRHDNPPPPLYRLSMTQLDGVECSVDSSHCEWEKRDSLRFSHINHVTSSTTSLFPSLLSFSLSPLPFLPPLSLLSPPPPPPFLPLLPSLLSFPSSHTALFYT